MDTSLKKIRLGRIHVHALTFQGALETILALAHSGRGGYVVTPNVDHVVLAEQDDALVEAYERAALSLVDGKPLVWLARLLGHPVPAKISGSDLAEPLVGRAAEEGLPVFFLGAAPGVGAAAAAALKARHPKLEVAGCLSPPLGFERDPDEDARVVEEVRRSGARLLLVALGAPKQELWLRRHAARLAPTVGLGIGATLDFLAGRVRRAPRWMSEAGLEWLYRLLQEPRRMAERYLVRDRAIFGIALRMLRTPVESRALLVPPPVVRRAEDRVAPRRTAATP